MQKTEDVKRITIVAGGTIGASWALYFLARGFDVTVYDAVPEKEGFVADFLIPNWPTAVALGLTEHSPPPAYSFTTDLADTQFVQESAPDDLAIKQALYAQLDRLVPPEVCIASSTSSLRISDLQLGHANEHRFVAAHPFNPPHILPLVEIVGGERTSEAAVDFTTAFFKANGKVVLKLNREIVRHVVNRLQCALFREALSLVQDGVIDVAGIDNGIAFGPGLRWAGFGPILSFHLAAQDGGIRQYLEYIGPAHERIWADLGMLDEGITPAMIDDIEAGVSVEANDASIAELSGQSDTRMIGIVRAALDSAEERGLTRLNGEV